MSRRKHAIDDPYNAFCTDTDAYLEDAPAGTEAGAGPLAGLTFAAKDIYDVAGHVTGGGNPDYKATHEPAEHTAWAVQVLVDAGATMVGKTITDELTRGIIGENAHYGMPVNPVAPGHITGGSSSGSVAAVAGKLVDFALGSDTGGSVRVPASFCGLYGLRPTHGRISLQHVLAQAPSFDTAGWFARDADLFARVGQVLLQTTIPPATPKRMVIAEDAFEQADASVATALRPVVDRLGKMIGQVTTDRISPTSLADWSARRIAPFSFEAWQSMGEWVEQTNPRLSYWVAERYVEARAVTAAQVEAARPVHKQITDRLDELVADDAVLAMPTSPSPALPRNMTVRQRASFLNRASNLTHLSSTSGMPQITLPLAHVDNLPVGLSLLAAHGRDELLIGFGRVAAGETND